MRESAAQHRRILLGVGAAFMVTVIVVVASRGHGFSLLFIGLLAVPSAAGLRAAQRGDWTLRVTPRVCTGAKSPTCRGPGSARSG